MSEIALNTVIELAARWHRAQGRLDGPTHVVGTLDGPLPRPSEYTQGRMHGYEQAIGLLLGSAQQDVRNALRAGEL